MDLRVPRRIRPSYTDEEKEAFRCLLQALEPFRQIRPTMPLQYVVAFLLSAIYEGEGVTELARRAGVSQSVMSRHLLDIGPRNRYGSGEGFRLVEQVLDQKELRKHNVIHTPKGRAAGQAIVRAMESFCRRIGGRDT
jgi:DNA-binding MarR family transcriptional regulator